MTVIIHQAAHSQQHNQLYAPKLKLTEVEAMETLSFTGPTNDRQKAVVKSFKHAWEGYKKYAWGHDHLLPLTKSYGDWFCLGLTIVDSLDTAYIMGLADEYQEGKKWIKDTLVFTHDKKVNLFEVTIRVLGALLTNYHLTKDKMFLSKAVDLGDRLMGAFNSSSRIPYTEVNLFTKTVPTKSKRKLTNTAEITSIQLEFRELSRLSGNPKYKRAAAAVSKKIHKKPKIQGLVPTFLSPKTGQFVSKTTITLGARGDSYYEYLLKQWIQTGKTLDYLLKDYLKAIEGVRDLLAKRSHPNNLLFIGEVVKKSKVFDGKMEHLACFLPGTLALGYANGLPKWHMTMAEELVFTCYLTYAMQPTFLAPETTYFNFEKTKTVIDMYTKNSSSFTLLRPELVESLWYMYQFTGNQIYQDWGWRIYQSLEKYARVSSGYCSLKDVRVPSPQHENMMESFFLAETLKYLYLLFSDDRFAFDLTKYVFNTEAHPLPILKN